MALGRKFLNGFSNLTDAERESILEAHLETVDALKKERDTYKADAEALPQVRQELETLKAAGDGGYKEKYTAEKAAHDAYRNQVETDRANAKKTDLTRTALENAGANKQAIPLLLKAIDMAKVELDPTGEALKDAGSIINPVKESYGGFFGTVSDVNVPSVNPPGGGKIITRDQLKTMSPAEINQNWDAVKAALQS